MRLHVAVMNVQSGVATTRGYWQYATTAWKYALPHSPQPLGEAGQLLKDENTNIAICTEVTEGGLRSGYASQLATLQASSGLAHSHFFPAMKTAFAVEGSAILSAYPITESWTHPLTGPKSQRVLGDALVHTDGGGVRVFAAHLSLRPEVRRGQILEVAHRVAEVTEPCILGGDFNEADDDAFAPITRLGFSEYSLPTYPSWEPSKKLVRIFIRGLSIREVRIPDSPLFSDHLPLIVTLMRE